MEIDFNVLGSVAGREQGSELFEHVGGEFYIESAARFVMEVGVRTQVGTVTRGQALEINGADEFVVDEGFEAVVDGGQGNRGHNVFYPGENLVGRGVISFTEKDLVNCFALRSGT